MFIEREEMFIKREEIDSRQGQHDYDLFDRLNQTEVQGMDSYEWEHNLDVFKIFFDYHCSYIDPHSLVQLYTYSNGTASTGIEYGDVMVDELEIHRTSEHYRDAILRHWLINAKATHARLEEALNAKRPSEQSDVSERDELRRLLSVPGPWKKSARWVVYIMPQVIVPSLVGWGVAGIIDWWKSSEQSDLPLNLDQFETWLVVFATSFAAALIIQLEKLVLGTQDDFVSQRSGFAIRALIIWLGNVWAWLRAGSWKYSSLGHVSYQALASAETSLLTLDPGAAGRPKVFVDGVEMKSRFKQLAALVDDPPSPIRLRCP